ncbi:MAG: DUF4115 domain-containing protein [Gammaproteobacteria bacterium]|nr:DUF4115 domain-containing protein [Gammaproteobacteria bacterium]
MVDDAPAEGSPRATTTVLGVGERLRSGRRARALSLQQVTEALRLDEASVVALEEGRFDALGAPVFVRGHLKRYAELLGLPVEGVLDAYRAAAPGSDAPPSLSKPAKVAEGAKVPNWIPWGIGMAVLVVALAMIGSGVDDDDTVIVQAPPPVAATVEVPADPAASVLEVSVTADAWIDIDDADRRILAGLQLRDSRQQFNVRLPVTIHTKNAPAVSISIDGQPVPIPPELIERNVATFTWPLPAPPAPATSTAPAAEPPVQ